MPMRSDVEFKAFAWGAVLASAMLPGLAHAALGDSESAVSVDAQRLHGTLKTTQHSNYRLHEIQLPSGTSLREYATAGGTVFAVAWNGPSMPNLRQAFGRYFEEFTTAAQAAHSGHTHLQIRQDDLVVQSSGHMRAFAGRAYLPQGVPYGTSVDELR